MCTRESWQFKMSIRNIESNYLIKTKSKLCRKCNYNTSQWPSYQEPVSIKNYLNSYNMALYCLELNILSEYCAKREGKIFF